MPRKSPYVIVLNQEERTCLERLSRSYTSPYRDVIRAKIVLLAAQGLPNDVIASRLDTPPLCANVSETLSSLEFSVE